MAAFKLLPGSNKKQVVLVVAKHAGREDGGVLIGERFEPAVCVDALAIRSQDDLLGVEGAFGTTPLAAPAVRATDGDGNNARLRGCGSCRRSWRGWHIRTRCQNGSIGRRWGLRRGVLPGWERASGQTNQQAAAQENVEKDPVH